MNHRKPSEKRAQQGFALITVMLLVAVLAVMVTAYFMLTQVEMTTSSSSENSTSGFYAAEAGLNIRGQELRDSFNGYRQPSGVSPENNSDKGIRACQSYTESGVAYDNSGEGDFACRPHDKANGNEIAPSRRVVTYVSEPGVAAGETQEPTSRTLSDGSFAGLNALEYVYDVRSESFRVGDDELPEARLQTTFRSQLIPLFQFAAFYDQDLEIAPGAPMNLAGRVHSNGDLYMMNSTLGVSGNVTSAGNLYGGRKLDPNATCSDFKIKGKAIGCNAGRNKGADAGYTDQELTDLWQDDEVQQGIKPVQVPEPEFLDPDPKDEQTNDYWEQADLRVVLEATKLNNGTVIWQPRVKDKDGRNVRDANRALRRSSQCGNLGAGGGGPLGSTDTFYNHREKTDIRMLEVDMEALLECIDENSSAFGIPGGLRDDTQGGLVFHFSVDDSRLGRDSTKDGVNNYGVRVKNGAELDDKVKGLTVVTNQAMYVQGDYNSEDKKPASFLADSLNILSNDWQDLADEDGVACTDRGDDDCMSAKERTQSERQASETVINAAFMAGVDQSTSGTGYNGGLENYPRLHERWGKETALRIRGSFVSLGEPKHVDGKWKDSSYKPPERDWNFDTDFNDAKNLPPLSPRFVNLVQQLFTRSFEANDWEETNSELLVPNETY